MKLGTYRDTQGLRVVAVTADSRWLDVGAALGSDAPWTRDVGQLIAAGPQVWERVRQAVQQASGPFVEPDEARLAPPIPQPRKIFCIGLNYREHARETGAALPQAPEIFLRGPHTLVGPRDPVPMPSRSERFDLESELAVVIGRPARHVPAEEALRYVFGYTVFNDLSVRDFQRRGSQWTPGKNWDGSGPCGPFVVTTDEIPNPASLRISSSIDNFVMQDSHTGDMIFDVPTLIADITTFATLEPGDLIVTGTPPGVGDARKPPRYLRVGETAVCTIEGIGSLRNPVVSEEEWLRQRGAPSP
jgi:acylpyruvate hydrolase